MTWLRSGFLLALGLACVLALTSCGVNNKPGATHSSAPAGDLPPGWAQLTKPGFTKDYTAVAYFSRGRDAALAKDDAYLAFMDPRGGVRLERVGPIENGIVRSHGRSFAFDSEKDTFFVDGAASTSYRRPGKNIGSGHRAAFTTTGWDVSVINIGRLEDGYLTEVNSQKGDQQIRNTVRDVPGAVGFSGNTVYLMSAGSSNADGTVSLHQVDVSKPNSAHKLLEFRPYADPAKEVFDAVSDLHVKDNKIWFTYYQTPISATGSFLNGKRTLRLGQIDLTTKEFSSTTLSQNPWLLGDGPKGVVPVSVAGLDGYLHDGLLYTINTAGEIMSINPEAATIHNIGRVGEVARNSFRVLAAWHGSEVTLLSVDGKGGAQLATYSLKDAHPASTIDVPELGTWYAQNLEIIPWSVATFG